MATPHSGTHGRTGRQRADRSHRSREEHPERRAFSDRSDSPRPAGRNISIVGNDFIPHRKPHKNPGLDIRRSYRTTLMFGLVLSLGLVILAVRADLTAQSGPTDVVLAQQELVQMEEIVQTQQMERPPPPPRPPVPVEVPDDTFLEDETLDLDMSLDLDEALTNPTPPPMPPPSEEQQLPEPEIFVAVEQMPEVIGGSQKVYEYLEYPILARQAGLEGLVVVQIVVNETGIPSDATILRSAGGILDEAAQKAVMMLRFTPGRQRGRAVKVRMSVPIRFQLIIGR